MQQLHCEGNWGSVNGLVLTPPATSVSCEGLRDFTVSRWRESFPNFLSADTRLFFIEIHILSSRSGKTEDPSDRLSRPLSRMRFLIPEPVTGSRLSPQSGILTPAVRYGGPLFKEVTT
jgi:hypothetical protein